MTMARVKAPPASEANTGSQQDVILAHSRDSRESSKTSSRGEEDGSGEARSSKRRVVEVDLSGQRRSSFPGAGLCNRSGDMRVRLGSFSEASDAYIDELEQAWEEEHGGVGDSSSDSSNPQSPRYVAEVGWIDHLSNVNNAVLSQQLASTAFRGPLSYYNLVDSAMPNEKKLDLLYPVVRGVSRDNTKKRWAVYWKGLRRYFYDKTYESCVEAYRKGVLFRQKAQNGAAEVEATGDPSHLIALGLHGSPSSSNSATAVLASAAALRANAGASKDLDSEKAIVRVYKEAIQFVLEDLRMNVVRRIASVSATSAGSANGFPVEAATALTAKRLLSQLVGIHSSFVGAATSTSELEPLLMIMSSCLEEQKLPSSQTPQQQEQLLQSFLAMHIQQFVLLSRYLNKNKLPTEGKPEPER